MRDIDTLRMILGGTKAKAPRKPRAAAIKEGAACAVGFHTGTVVGKHPTRKGWWNVAVTNPATDTAEAFGFDRSQIRIL